MSETKNEMMEMIQSMRLVTKLSDHTYTWAPWGHWEYTDWIEESMSWHDTCYLGDWSFLTEVHVKGPDALKLLSDLSVNSYTKFDVGQAKHAIMCNKDGYIIVEGVVQRLGEEEFVAMTVSTITYIIHMLKKGRYNATAEVIDWANFQIAGPKAVSVVEKVAGESLHDLKWMHFRKIKINGIEVNALRLSMSGEIGFELQAPGNYHDALYKILFQAGKQFGIRRLGRRVAQVTECESCVPTVWADYLPAIYGEDEKEFLQELNDNYPKLFNVTFKIAGSFEADDISGWYKNPVELGWANRIKFDHEFIGRKALEAEVANPKKTIVTLVWNAEDVCDVHASLFQKGDMYDYMELPRMKSYTWFDSVMKDGKIIGDATNRCYSAFFREMLSLCTIDIEFSKPGTKVTVVWGKPGGRKKNIRAVVAPAPYKPITMRDSLL
jgi:vanillate/3-O-methylgallate O-demethylase